MNFIRRHEVWIFLAAIVIVNAIFVTLVVEGFLPKSVYGLGRFLLLGAVLFGLIFCVRRWSGVTDVLSPMVVWKRSPLFYLFAIAWTVTLCLIVLGMKGLFTGSFVSLEQVFSGLRKVTHPPLFLTLFVSSFFGEIVWISYAVRKLTERFTPYVSGLIVGAVWTLWWLPMAIYDFGIIPELPLLALLFNQMGIAVMCAFVYHHTRSGLIVLVMQIVFNATILIFPVTPTEGGPATYWAFALTYFVAATLLFLRFGPRPLMSRETKCSPA